MFSTERLIKENNTLVEEIDSLNENDMEFSKKYYRYLELQRMIELNRRADKQKEISEIRNFITNNRNEILDIFNNKCEVCNFDFIHSLVIHHRQPISEGGTNELNNLSVLCSNCHSIVHHIMRTLKNGSGGWKSFEHIDKWANNSIPNNQYMQLIKIVTNKRGE